MDIKNIIECILKGCVVLYPTDTVYGLAALPTNELAVGKIFDLKLRPRDRFLPIMVSKISDIEMLGLDINLNASKLLNSHLIPGALTLVLGFKTESYLYWLKGREEVAIRIPNDVNLLEILNNTGPLLVTSANKHSISNTPCFVDDILAQLNGKPDLVIDGGERQEIPSTIVNCRFTPPVIERIGVVPSDEIFKILSQ